MGSGVLKQENFTTLDTKKMERLLMFPEAERGRAGIGATEPPPCRSFSLGIAMPAPLCRFFAEAWCGSKRDQWWPGAAVPPFWLRGGPGTRESPAWPSREAPSQQHWWELTPALPGLAQLSGLSSGLWSTGRTRRGRIRPRRPRQPLPAPHRRVVEATAFPAWREVAAEGHESVAAGKRAHRAPSTWGGAGGSTRW